MAESIEEFTATLRQARIDNASSAAGISGPQQNSSLGPSKKLEIPNEYLGRIVGIGGETVKRIELLSGAKIQLMGKTDADPNMSWVKLMGTPYQIAFAERLIANVFTGAKTTKMKIPINKVGHVMGKGGKTIKHMQATTGARIQVLGLHLPPPRDMPNEREVQIDGTSEQIQFAKLLVKEVISESHMINQPISVGYQARPPTYWAQPGYCYGYNVRHGPSPQYNQPPYSGGYATGGDQSSAQQIQQPPQAHIGPGAPTDGYAYRYGYGIYGQPYAQPEQAPGAQVGGYSHLPPTVAGYIATQSGAQRPPSSYYSTSQPAYIIPPYGAPRAIQPCYVQPPPYGSAYGGGYSQPPAYSSDGSNGGNARRSYDETPPQSAEPIWPYTPARDQSW